MVWNRTLADRHARYQAEGKSTSYRESDAALTAMKKLPDLAWLNEVSSVPLQQTLRHQHKAFEAFSAKRARYPRFKSRRSKQSATYTRAAFRWRDGQLMLAKTSAPLRFVWSWPDIDPAALDPTTVTVSRDPAGRWFVVLHADVAGPGPLPATGESVAYKAERHGRELAVVDRWYPSSKTCSACGHLLASLSLGTRSWVCPGCGVLHQRDINAAKNIALAAGLAAPACGGGVRRTGATRPRSPVKQEPQRVTAGIPVL